MPQKTVYHVVPSGEEWAVKKEGAEQASRVAATQKEAMRHAESFARKQTPSQIVVHGADGLITGTHSFDTDAAATAPWLSVVTSPPVLTGLAVALGLTGLAYFFYSRD